MESDLESIAREIKRLLQDKLMVAVAVDDEDLLDTGVLDSMTLIQLLVHLEERFGLKIPLEELEIDDLRSVASIALLVGAHTQRVQAVSAD